MGSVGDEGLQNLVGLFWSSVSGRPAEPLSDAVGVVSTGNAGDPERKFKRPGRAF